ncbi:MAG: reductive dehalogenase domain-containing protein, partial [Chloroflexota bacterium]
MNDQGKKKLTRRDFLRVLGLGASAVVVGAAVQPVAAAPALSANPSYEYKRFSDPAGRSQRPWWVRTVDQPTMEIDWTKMKRYNEGYKADLGTGTVRGKGFEAYVGKDKNAELVKLSADTLAAGIANNTPGYTLKDQSLNSAHSVRVPMSFMGPQKAKTPEDYGATKWTGTPEEASRILRAALRHNGAATVGFVVTIAVEQLVGFNFSQIWY